jgi:CHAT domain-containing protein/tetratricopeptide (TPR) repeat protein
MTALSSAMAQRAGAARTADELDAAACDAAEGRELAVHVLRLADRLEAAGAPSASGIALGVAARVTAVAGPADACALATARRDAIAAQLGVHGDEGEDAVAALDRAASALAACDDVVRAADSRIACARALLARGDYGEAVRQAHAAIDELEGRPEALDTAAQRDADIGATLRPVPRTVELLLFRLERELLDAPPQGDTCIVLARAAQLLQRAGREDLRAIAGAQLGCALVRVGDAERGLEVLHDTLPLVRRTVDVGDGAGPPPLELGLGQYWRARALERAGRLDEALADYRTHVWWEHGTSSERAELTVRMATLLLDQGRLPEAIDVLAAASAPRGSPQAALLEALRAIDRSDDPPAAPLDTEAGAQARLVWMQRHLDHECAGEELSELEAVAERYPMANIGSAVSRARGDLASARADARSALAHYRAALDALREPKLAAGWEQPWYGTPLEDWRRSLIITELRGSREGRGVGAELWLRIAHAEVALGEDPEASFAKAIEGAARRNLHATLFEALLAKARWLHDAEAPPEEQTDCLERAADILEGLRAQLRDEDLQLGSLIEQDTVYAQLLRTALDDRNVDGALRVVERAKARTLLDRASAERSAISIGLAEGDEARILRERIVRTLGRQLAEPWATPADTDLVDLKRRLGTVYRRRRRPPVAARPGATPDEMRRMVVGGALVLHYFCEPDSIVVAPVGAEPMVLETSPQEVQALLEASAAERQLRSFPHSLVELYERLVAPFDPLLDRASRVLVIPHGVLHAVPFHALQPRRGPHLLERLPVSYAPSAAVALEAGERLTSSAGEAGSVAFGLGVVGYLPLGPLANVAGELDAIADVLPNTERYDGTRALRHSLLDLDGDLDVLHFACHGEFDPDDPLLSRLYLADGPVYGYELLDLGVVPRLVVFSACETARHERLPGDEVLGLVRPFLGLGAGAVIATLWEVPDDSTAALMASFYREYVSAPRDPAACLRTAQLELLRSQRYAHPHYWAPYAVVGGMPLG